MFQVIHKSDNANSEHEDEEGARKQVIGAYGPDVIFDEDDRPSGRLRVWRHEADRIDDFASPVAKIVIIPDVVAEQPKKEPVLKDFENPKESRLHPSEHAKKEHETKRSPPIQATEDVDQSEPSHPHPHPHKHHKGGK